MGEGRGDKGQDGEGDVVVRLVEGGGWRVMRMETGGEVFLFTYFEVGKHANWIRGRGRVH